jgi:hypothetical protein
MATLRVHIPKLRVRIPASRLTLILQNKKQKIMYLFININFFKTIYSPE